MRVSRIQAEENRQTVINVAGRLFREHGFPEGECRAPTQGRRDPALAGRQRPRSRLGLSEMPRPNTFAKLPLESTGEFECLA